MKKPEVREIVDTYDNRENIITLTKSLAKRENLIKKAYDVAEKAETRNQLSVALQGIDLTAKLARLYEKDREDPGNWQQLVQNILVVNPPTTPQHVVVDTDVEVVEKTQDNT